MRGTFGEYCTRGMRTIRRCSFLSCSPATLPLICCIHHLHQQPSRPAPGLLRSLLCLESHWTYEAVPHFDVNGIALVVSRCILLCSQLVVRPNWTRSDHRVWSCPEYSKSCSHYSLQKHEFVKVILEYDPQSQIHLVPSTHLNPSETETRLSHRSSSSNMGPTKHLWNHHPKKSIYIYTLSSKMRLMSWHKKRALRNAVPGYWRPVVPIALGTWPRHPPRVYPGALQSSKLDGSASFNKNVSHSFFDICCLISSFGVGLDINLESLIASQFFEGTTAYIHFPLPGAWTSKCIRRKSTISISICRKERALSSISDWSYLLICRSLHLINDKTSPSNTDSRKMPESTLKRKKLRTIRSPQNMEGFSPYLSENMIWVSSIVPSETRIYLEILVIAPDNHGSKWGDGTRLVTNNIHPREQSVSILYRHNTAMYWFYQGLLWWTLPFGNEYTDRSSCSDCNFVVCRIFSNVTLTILLWNTDLPYTLHATVEERGSFLANIILSAWRLFTLQPVPLSMLSFQQLAYESQSKTWRLFPFQSHFESFFSEPWLRVILKYFISLDVPKLHETLIVVERWGFSPSSHGVAGGPFLPELRRFLRISVRADGPAGQICVLRHLDSATANPKSCFGKGFFVGCTKPRIWKMNLDCIWVQ